jgi:hypothetical protein
VDQRDPPLARAREILEHYLTNPETADSLEGIAEWRLLEDFVQRRVEETDEALRWLVSRGALQRIESSGAAPPLYRLNVETAKDVEQLLEEIEKLEPPPPPRGER